MPSLADAWVKRGKEILQNPPRGDAVQFAVSFLSAIYGPKSAQLDAFNTSLAQISKTAESTSNASHFHFRAALGAISNTIGEIEAGLIVSLRAVVAGEVFGELVGLGKEIVADNTESSKNVAAVLIAAAFEDLIRRMGSELAGIQGRPKLEEVVTTLKTAGVLKGGEVATAISYLKSRNDSLHAHWANVQVTQVHSCTAFIESLLVKHFS